jgi:hypothetical protein
LIYNKLFYFKKEIIIMTDNYSLSDIAAVTDGNRNSGMFGNDAWWIIILLLFGYNGRGFGGFGGGQGGYGMPCGVPATQADLAAGFNNSAVLSGINGIDSALCQGFNGINTAILQSTYDTQGAINGLSHQLSDCCCATQRAIDSVKYENATNTCAIQNTIQNTTRDVIDNANANSRAILDFLTQDKIATLTAENQSLKFAASQSAQNAFITANQEAQTAELIRRLGRDCPVPAYVVPNPNCCYNANVTFGNGCGCGSF